MRSKALILAPLLVAAGCAAVGPDYRQPPVALTPAFVGGTGGPVAALASREWWRDYRDPLLNELVGRGLAQALTVQSARAAIAGAEANLRATGVNEALSGSASASRDRSGGSQKATGYRSSSTLSADVVLDMFGGIRRDREAAAADLQAAHDDLQTARLAWLAELIAAYADARYYQQALTLAHRTMATRRQTLDITRTKFEAGAATELDVAQAQALLDTAAADVPNDLAQFNANVFAIATLLNEPAGPLLARMQQGGAPLRTPGTVPTGVPADLLRNRPDVRSAEASLHAATARVGVATADMLPSVTLGGSVANASGVKSWSFGPSVSLPLLNQGALAAARDAKIAAARQAEIAWRSAVTGAVGDVQLAQSNLTQFRARRVALDRAAASYGTALSLAQENYRNGATSLLDLLDTDRSKYSADVSAASAANTAAQEWATLQIATGAGAGSPD